MKLIRILALSALLAGVAMSAVAQDEPDYLDDRSDAGRLVESFYNAIARKEYARAWGYFGEQKPSKDFASFTNGYSKTERVAVMTGAIAEEGAAGSTFFSVPVAIEAASADGSVTMFAGCYTARRVDPRIQEPPFRPLQLEKGKLSPAAGPLDSALPERCEDAPAPKVRDVLLDKARARFRANYADVCQSLGAGAAPGDAKPDAYTITFRTGSDLEERSARLFRFPCTTGAYNSMEVYFFADDLDQVRELHFAEPDLDIRYDGQDSREKVESLRIVGFNETDQIANSDFDEASQTITSFAKWRGVGDTSSTGTYLFRNGRFTLVKYEVDATEDGEINPETVLDYDTAP